MKSGCAILLVLFGFFFPGATNSVFAANGYFLHGLGPANEALGGTGVAGNSRDIIGTLHRNPAGAVLFKGRTASIGAVAIFPNVTDSSSVDIPGLSGSSDSEVDIIPCASMGLVLNNENSRTAWYMALLGEAGLHLDIPESTSNPIFMPQPGKPNNPFGGVFGGFGALETQLEVVRIPLGVSYRFDSKWAMGLALAPSVARMKFKPGAFDAPDDANGDGIPTYPTDLNHELAFGMGFQAGIRYQATDELGFGLSLNSPTWFEKFEWDVEDELGNSREISFCLNRPLTVGLGMNYRLTSRTLLLMDVSWINYSNTRGFDRSGFASDGSLAGLGWDDIWVLSFGVQQDMGNLTLRAGYNYGGNPIDDDNTFFNAASLLHSKHHLSFGGSYAFKQLTIDMGYTHTFKSSQSGPLYDDMNAPVPGSEIETELDYDQISMGFTFPF